MENTIVILSSDHGESFREGYVGHGGRHLFEQVTHVPLIIWEPGQVEGRIINDIVDMTDIPATILDLVDVPVPSWMEGRPLVPLMRGEKLPSRPVFSMNFQRNYSLGHQITDGTIAVWDGDYKLVYYLDDNETMLFNLKSDTEESRNLSWKRPELKKRLMKLINDNLSNANLKIAQSNEQKQ